MQEFKNFDLQLTVPIEQIRNRVAQPLMQRLLRLKGTPRLTDRTLVSESAVIEEIDKVRQRGRALDNQENEFDGRCIGSAIVGPDGRVIAALRVSGPVFRMDMARTRARCEDRHHLIQWSRSVTNSVTASRAR